MDMQRFDDISREIPVLANIRPSGALLMEDFFYAGGLRALMAELKPTLDLSCLTVTGKTVGDNIASVSVVMSAFVNPRKFLRMSVMSLTSLTQPCRVAPGRFLKTLIPEPTSRAPSPTTATSPVTMGASR